MKQFLLAGLLALTLPIHAHEMNDDPLLTMFKIDKLEKSDLGTSNDISWDMQAWIGQDINKLWIKTEGDVADSHLEQAETQILYSRAIAPTWDLQIGWRHDSKPTPERDWLAFGLQGLAPYFFETELHLFVADTGNIALRTKLNYDLLFSQKLILTPEFQANLYSKDDLALATGKGVSDIELGLRLRYEIGRKFAPYVGLEWTKELYKTADISRDLEQQTSEFQWVLGLKAWW